MVRSTAMVHAADHADQGVRRTVSMMARPKGFEPLTPRFVVWCSIQLSYGRIRIQGMTPSSEAA